MADIDKNEVLSQEIAATPPESSLESKAADAKQEKQPVVRRRWIPAAALGLVLAIVAWVSMPVNEHVSFWSGVVGAIVSLCAALRVGKSAWRDAAITALIATGVLLIVYGVFYVAILLALNSL